jgi:transposase
VRGKYGKSLLKRRGEFVERSFAHCYETGAMRRCTLRGTKNILKRQLIHVGAFNISLVLRKMLGAGTPRELKNRALNLILRVFAYLIGLCGERRPLLARKDEISPLRDGFCAEGFYC